MFGISTPVVAAMVHWVVFILWSVVGILSGVILVHGLSLVFWLVQNCYRGRYMRNKSGIVIFTLNLIKSADHLAFLENEDMPSSLELIGHGGCGEVFKAQLPVEREGEEPRFIAIKKVGMQVGVGPEESRKLDKRKQQIQAEINTVGHIRHRNLLPLAAHVMRPDCQYLIYEYMKNGSLQNALKKVTVVEAEEDDNNNITSSSNGNRVVLSWPERLHVAIGIASGLEYLHDSQQPQIIHRDLKTANILLDDDMEARIADFGLAKTMPDEQTHASTSQAVGTWGYIAPEYNQTHRLTTKCDLYSFGIILTVLVTGKEPTDHFFMTAGKEGGPVKWLRQVLQSSDYAEAIDPAIAGAGHEEYIKHMMRIALFCTDRNPNERPTAKDVRCMLTEIKTSLAAGNRVSNPRSEVWNYLPAGRPARSA